MIYAKIICAVIFTIVLVGVAIGIIIFIVMCFDDELAKKIGEADEDCYVSGDSNTEQRADGRDQSGHHKR